VLRFDPEHQAACFHRGQVHAKLRRFGSAITDWERVIALAPTSSLATAARAQARSARELAHILQPVGS